MPLSVEDVIAAGKQRGIDMTKYEGRLRQKFGQTGVPEPDKQFYKTPAAPQVAGQSGITQNPDINALITQALGKSGTMPQKSLTQNIGDTLTVLGGGKPESTSDDLSKLYAQEAIKKQFEDDEYVVSYDQSGSPVFTKAPGNIKNAPFYSSQQGGQYYQAKTGQAEAQGKQAQVETGLMEQVMPAVQSA